MLLQDSRRQARFGPGSDVELLRDQDRARWDRRRMAGDGAARPGPALDAAAEPRRALAGPVPAAVERHLHRQPERCIIASATHNHPATDPERAA
jgi:predicted RNA polymerase sigma factor